MFKSASMVLLALLFASCEGNTDLYWNLVNDSQQSIQVIATSNFMEDTLMVNLPAWSKQNIYLHSLRGGQSKQVEPGSVFGYFAVVSLSGDTCIKNAMDLNNWTPTIYQKRRIPSNYQHDYVFVLNDSDF